MIRWMSFGIGSLLLVVISGRSLLHPYSHGFYRFFAWESIMVLFLMNAGFWFYQPFVWNQMIAWSLLFLCLFPLVLGIHSLRTRGRAAQQREDDPSLFGFEKTTQLVTDGIYHYIRHPLYSSLFLLAWGIFFKSPSWLGMVLAVTAALFLVATAKADETECTQFFGIRYQEYMKKTKMFIPYIL